MLSKDATSSGRRFVWRGTEDEQQDARLKACQARRAQYGQDACDSTHGECEDCEVDMHWSLRVKPVQFVDPDPKAAPARVDLLTAVKVAMPILDRAESNASGTPEFDRVGPAVAAVRAALAARQDALSTIADDYMTSEAHHPGYVLIPTAKFEELRALGAASPT